MSEIREKYHVILAICVSFAALLVMIVVLSFTLIEGEKLQVKSEAERAFSSIFMALQEGDAEKARSTMVEFHVYGAGIYSSTGRRVSSLGVTPPVLDISRFPKENIDTGEILYNPITGRVEYIRFSRLNVALDSGVLSLDSSGNIVIPIDFPDVLYEVFDGTSYHHHILLYRCIGIFGALFTIIALVAVLRLYLNNLHYRQRLQEQERLVNLGQAARTLTHEIKNPLSAITLQLALLKKILPSGYESELELLSGEVKRLTYLTDRISEFLRNPEGNPEPIRLSELFETLENAFKKEIPVTGDAVIVMDRDRARSVFENLIKNGFESCTGRDPSVTVEIRQARHQLVHIYVRDRGDGLSGDLGEKVFDPFFTTKMSGSGIGLAICRQFLVSRGGSIELRQREGGGCEVQVTLPGVRSHQ